MYRLPSRTTCYTKNQENSHLNEKTQWLDDNVKMTQMSELPDKDSKAAITNMLQWQLQMHMRQMKEQKVSAKKQEVLAKIQIFLNGNFITRK